MRSRRVDELLSFAYFGVVSSWVDEQTNWWVFEFCLFWGLCVLELMNRRIDKFLSLFLRRLCVLFLRRLCVCALMSSCVFEMVDYWVGEFASWGGYKLMNSWACELTSWCLRELLGFRKLAYPRVALFPRYVYKEECSSCVDSTNLDPLKVNTASIKVGNAFSGRTFQCPRENKKTHEGLPNSQLFRNIANE